MNFLDWVQIAFSLVVMLIGLFIALSSPPRRRVLLSTRLGGFGVALLGVSYFVGGFEGPAVQTPLFDSIEAGSAVVGILVVLGALLQAREGR